MALVQVVLNGFHGHTQMQLNAGYHVGEFGDDSATHKIVMTIDS